MRWLNFDSVPCGRGQNRFSSKRAFFVALAQFWQRPLPAGTESLFFNGSFLLRVMGFGSVPCGRGENGFSSKRAFFVALAQFWQRPLPAGTESLFFKGSFLLRMMGFGSVPCGRGRDCFSRFLPAGHCLPLAGEVGERMRTRRGDTAHSPSPPCVHPSAPCGAPPLIGEAVCSRKQGTVTKAVERHLTPAMYRDASLSPQAGDGHKGRRIPSYTRDARGYTSVPGSRGRLQRLSNAILHPRCAGTYFSPLTQGTDTKGVESHSKKSKKGGGIAGAGAA